MKRSDSPSVCRPVVEDDAEADHFLSFRPAQDVAHQSQETELVHADPNPSGSCSSAQRTRGILRFPARLPLSLVHQRRIGRLLRRHRREKEATESFYLPNSTKSGGDSRAPWYPFRPTCLGVDMETSDFSQNSGHPAPSSSSSAPVRNRKRSSNCKFLAGCFFQQFKTQ